MTATRRIASILTGTALGFGLLASVAPAAQATGSHKESGSRQERSSVDTRDWPQGKSQSDPDGMSNGGWDKPGSTGGSSADRDGNNGCGNDDDREDDNNGNCGRKHDKKRAPQVKGDIAAQEKGCRDKGGKPKVEGADTKTKSDDKVKCEKDTTLVAAATTPAPVKVEAAVVVTPAPAVVAPAAVTPAAVTTPAPATTVLGAVEVAPAATATPTPADTQVLGITETRPDTLARTGFGLAGLVAAAGACFGGGRLFSVMRRRMGS